MRARDALVAGIRMLMRERWLVVGLWLVNVAFALPAAWVVTDALEASIGGSRVHESLRDGFDMGWFGEFEARTAGLAATFSPTLSGGGAFLDNMEAWVSGSLFTRFPLVLGIAAGYVVVWLVLLGGVLDRFAGDDEDRSLARLFGAGGHTLLRFVRLALMSAALYALIYLIQRALFGRLENWSRDTTSEWPVLLLSLAVYLATALQLLFVQICFGYAKVATVVDERRSMVLAAVRGFAFVLLHPRQTLGLASSILGAMGLLLALYAWLAPGSGQASVVTIVAAFAVGQIVLLIRLGGRLTHLAGQTVLYRRLSGAA